MERSHHTLISWMNLKSEVGVPSCGLASIVGCVKHTHCYELYKYVALDVKKLHNCYMF